MMLDTSVCIAVIEEHQQVNSAIIKLLESGFDAARISVVGKDQPGDTHIHGYATTGEQMRFWGVQGAIWGSIMGMLAGVGFLFIPGIGPLMIGGPLLSILVGGLEGAAGLAGIEALFAGLLHLGFTQDHLTEFEKELKAGKSLLILHGTKAETAHAKEVLNDVGVLSVSIYSN